MICHKCTNSICKAYHGTCRRFRFLRFITFGKYGKNGQKENILMKYNVYKIQPRLGCYRGLSLVSAKSVEEANCIIKDFVKSDPKTRMNSWGYSQVSKHDLIEGLYSEK